MSKHKHSKHRDKKSKDYALIDKNVESKLTEKPDEHMNTECKIKASCDFEDVEPAKANKPYPPIEVKDKNAYYADLLSQDFCGETSEFTAIAQYVNHEIRFSSKQCKGAKTLLAIAQTEMEHLQMIGELILLLGGTVDYTANTSLGELLWCGEYVLLEDTFENMIKADILGEMQAIEQYKHHIRRINDPCVKAVLKRIIEDEEYHIGLLKNILEEL